MTTPLPRTPRRRSPKGWIIAGVIAAAVVVLVADTLNTRVLKLAAGATTPTELPFTGLRNLTSVVMDSAGNLYVTDEKSRVLKLAAGATTPTELPLTGPSHPESVAVDSAGNLYVTTDVVNTGNGKAAATGC